jgi:hypothetical protein
MFSVFGRVGAVFGRVVGLIANELINGIWGILNQLNQCLLKIEYPLSIFE